MFLTKGIDHRLTCPHTHHQNGNVERKHIHVVETYLTLLAQASLPFKFWDHACLTATFLIYRMPTPIRDMKSPYFMIYGTFPEYKHFKTFGCACYPHLRPYLSNNFNFHSQECFFLGYSSSHRGFKCLDPSGRIYISKDDVFNEIKFPYPLLHSQPSIPSKHPSATTIESFHSHSAHSDHFSSNTFGSPIQTLNDSQTMSVYPSTSSSNNIS